MAGNRNSTPEATSSSLRPPSSRTIGANHHLRASADMGVLSSSPLSSRGIRPSSEVYFAKHNSPDDNILDIAAQQWIADIDQYQTTLEDMATATLDQDFKDELGAIEQWFRVLSEPERTAALYQLLQGTASVQQRFFIQVLKQMAKTHPMSSVLSPANFGEKDAMSQKLNEAMKNLTVDTHRTVAGHGRPPASPSTKRNSGLDSHTINSMFPDAAAAIAKQKADFAQHTGVAPTSNRNSAVIGDRTSMLAAPALPGLDDGKRDATTQPPQSPWGPRSSENQLPPRPKSSSSSQPQPMGQFVQPLIPANALLSPLSTTPAGDQSIRSTTVTATGSSFPDMPFISPLTGSWASAANTPLLPNFQPPSTQVEMVQSAAAMKMNAIDTVNRLQFEDPRKYRRLRSFEGQRAGQGNTNDHRHHNVSGGMTMANGHHSGFPSHQATALRSHQQMAMNNRSRPTSPGIAMNYASSHNNGFLAAGDPGVGERGMNLGAFGTGSHADYVSDRTDVHRGRSPRGRRGTSKPAGNSMYKDDPLSCSTADWLRQHRLHKYTENLGHLELKDLIELDDEALEKLGVAATGARRKLVNLFQQIKTEQAPK